MPIFMVLVTGRRTQDDPEREHMIILEARDEEAAAARAASHRAISSMSTVSKIEVKRG